MRKAPRASITTDVARPRTLALCALGAALGVGVTLAVDKTPLASERPISKPHAKLACERCHSETATAPAASASSLPAPPHPNVPSGAVCKSCHGEKAHASRRPAHRALAAKGELGCATCHPAHAGVQGVTFTDDGIVRWGAGAEVKVPKAATLPKGTTVPLVSLGVCAKCHDPSRAGDPIAACVPADVRGKSDADLRKRVSLCFDEHASLPITEVANKRPAGAVCDKQHDADRFVAWDAAREAAATTEWVAPKKKEGNPWMPAGGALAGALVLGASAAAVDRRRRKAAPAAAPKQTVPAERKRLPLIDPTTCLGCYACVDACPFDVLTIEKYVAVVARPEECCGVVLCEQVCPNGSLRIADGEPVLDRPATDEGLESRDVPGIFIAGDLTGLPLIKNAINQGVQAIDRIAATLPRRRSDMFDVVVVGAGPAGLSAALRAKEKGLSCVVVEQATIAASVKSFPRDKIVHDPPLDLPVEGELWLREATKEELLAQWTRIVRARELDVREGHRVVGIARAPDSFVVTTDQAGRAGEIRAQRVVIAIGRRGTPRRLELDIERGCDDRVAYALADARSFEGKRVVVVGLGDSAMEAALALARQPNTTVTISYRGQSFRRGKQRNVSELSALITQRKVKLLVETVPVAVTKTGVILSHANGGRRTIAADVMLVLIGGLPSWDLLVRSGIQRPKL